MRIVDLNRYIKVALDLTSSVAFVIACAAIAWSVLDNNRMKSTTTNENMSGDSVDQAGVHVPAEPLSLDGAIVDGNTKASIAVIEFSEFQCPYCGHFASNTLPTIRAKYVDSGKVLWAFRHFPLEQIHANAIQAAAAAECADRQRRFRQMHETLFEHQQELGALQLDEYARRIGLDMGQYSVCMAGPGEAKVRRDMDEGRSLGVVGTPTFFVGRIQSDGMVKVTKRLFGALATPVFAQVLEAELVSK